MSEKLQSLGFIINEEKSVRIPTQRITFFGYILDSVLFRVFLTPQKIEKIKRHASTLLQKHTVKIRDLASFIGLVINAFHAVLEAPMYYRSLERLKVKGLHQSTCSTYDSFIQLSQEAESDLSWWLKNVQSQNGKRIRPISISCYIQCDASLLGWGSYHTGSGLHTGGRWNSLESSLHINHLELLAIFFALKSWFHDKTDMHIAIQSDNSTAISYVNNMGGMCSCGMDFLAKEIWLWCLERNIYISASHLSGILNIHADFF